jgi:hypothetical protein
LPRGSLVELVDRQSCGDGPQDLGEGPAVERSGGRPLGRRRGEHAVQGEPGRKLPRIGGELCPSGRVGGYEVDEDAGAARRAVAQLVGEPVPGQRRVPQRRRGGAGEREVRQSLSAVDLTCPAT